VVFKAVMFPVQAVWLSCMTAEATPLQVRVAVALKPAITLGVTTTAKVVASMATAALLDSRVHV